MNTIFHIISAKSDDLHELEVLSAYASSVEGLVGIDEMEGGWDFCFDSASASKEFYDIVVEVSPDLELESRTVANENWNQIWEESFEPVVVNDYCAIIAPHHDQSVKVKHVINILPEMSFGTGHHETTYMMIDTMTNLEMVGKKVLDFGCGTGVLAILAAKEGAASVHAIDYDELCISSTRNNTQVNHCGHITVQLGDATAIADTYDIILANVNRNVLIAAAERFAQHIVAKGFLLLSGVLLSDEKDLLQIYGDFHFKLVDRKEKGEWVAFLFEKS